MAEVALTNISVGREVDGKFERVEVAAGDKLPSWVSDADKKALKANGALGEPVATSEELENKDALIAELRAKLAAAEAVGQQEPVAQPGAKPADKEAK